MNALSLSKADLKEVVKEAVKEELKQREQPQQSQGHDTIKDMVNCPNCYPKAIEEIQKFNYQCQDCELPLPDSLVEGTESIGKKCPRCGSEHADKIEREE